MRRSWPAALVAGVLTAFVAAGFPALAAESSITTQSNNTWSQTDIQIQPGDTVTWTNDSKGYHNLCVAVQGYTADFCTPFANEFRNGEPTVEWSQNPTNSHTFNTVGVFHFMCEVHGGSGMKGTIRVGEAPGTTETFTATTPSTTGTGTSTQPVVTQTVPKTATPSAPRFTGKLLRKANKTRLIVDMGSSKAATLEVSVSSRAKRSTKFKRVGSAKFKVKAGRNLVRLAPKTSGSMRKGSSFRVSLELVDVDGRRSPTQVLAFAVK